MLLANGELTALLARILLDSFDCEDATLINLECHQNLRDTSGSRRNAFDLETAQEVIVACHQSLSLVHFDSGQFLVVLVCREQHRMFSRQLRVSAQNRSHEASSCLDSKRKRNHVDQAVVLKSLLGAPGCSLQRSPVRDHLVGIDAAA
mmetsp:Transcript_42490/g.99033  ORF Transcript_42490/g.99033 Transcript_42490/m.99033 type:complete len:148 (-) Transcript_42490:17-460(-)